MRVRRVLKDSGMVRRWETRETPPSVPGLETRGWNGTKSAFADCSKASSHPTGEAPPARDGGGRLVIQPSSALPHFIPLLKIDCAFPRRHPERRRCTVLHPRRFRAAPEGSKTADAT